MQFQLNMEQLQKVNGIMNESGVGGRDGVRRQLRQTVVAVAQEVASMKFPLRKWERIRRLERR